MLWYKGWRETRVVTLVGVAAMAGLCGMTIFVEPPMRNMPGVVMSHSFYMWNAMYDSVGRDMFLLLTIILGSGGLMQEKVAGTVGFTLALPVSRGRVIFWRAVMGYVGVVAIALTPVAALPISMRNAGVSYPVEQTLGFSLLWMGCGAAVYGATFLLAHFVEGEQMAVLLAAAVLIGYGGVMEIPVLARHPMLNLFDLIAGDELPYLDGRSGLLTGTLPWPALLVMVVIGAGMVMVAQRRMRVRDFS